jgi:hypothetical protein
MLGTFKREKEPVHKNSCKDDLKRDGHDLGGVGASAVFGPNMPGTALLGFEQ